MYEPRFDIDYRRGLVGETLVESFLAELAGSRIEVKTDHRVLETGNVFVETHQQPLGGDWKPSGINVSESEFYCFAGPSGNGFITIKKHALLGLAKDARRANVNTQSEYSSAARGRLVPVIDIVESIFEGTR